MNVKDTKAFRLFAALTAQERKDFVRFLRRHSKPKRESLRASVRYLAVQAEAITQQRVTNEDWWQAVFPGEQFRASHLRKHQNKLVADLEEFMVECKLRREADPYRARLREAEQMLLLLEALHARGLQSLFLSYLKRAEALVQDLPQDHDRESLRLNLALLKIDFHQAASPFKPRPEFQDAQVALDHYYMVNSLKLEVANRNQQRLNPQQLGLARLGTVMPAFEGVGGELVQSYLRLLDMRADIPEGDLSALIEQIIGWEALFAPNTWKDLLYICLNQAIRRINEGHEIFRLPVLRIYIVLLQAGLLQRDVSAFRLNFVNIVKLAFFRDPPEELSRYVRDQKELLEKDEEYRNAVQFFKCLELYSQRDFKKCNACFSKVWLLEGGRNVRYAAGVALLKSLYEAGEVDRVQDFAVEFKRQVVSDRNMGESKREAFLGFLRVLASLCKVQFRGLNVSTRRRFAKLRAEVEADRGIIAHTWLMEKIAAFQ